MDWYDYFPLGPGVNDDEEQDDIWSIWTFDGDDFLKMWLLAWGDHYEELFPSRDSVSSRGESASHLQPTATTEHRRNANSSQLMIAHTTHATNNCYRSQLMPHREYYWYELSWNDL
ncbi:hypothetical protein QR680_012795 [Steinernema hermaphroditum]|uniref:Uncharacterized protein n=1 Tax=Steinernema hermaphroditum TaxID=289476 RepID=A0AA39I5B4_9BILA|nr:hypothetical protein QR680_012795 [Steinernema hermaphroditum]